MSVWQEVGDGVFRRRYPRLDLNVGAILTGEGVVVVDSRANHDDADELRRELSELTADPARWLINTHFHWDHTFGNARFPEAVVVGHRRCRDALVEDGVRVKEELAAADWIPEEHRPSFLTVDIRPPEIVFDDAVTLFPGGRRILISHPGRGHTDSDVIVVVDDVCFAGDLVEEGAPPGFGDAFPRAWVDTLGRLGPALPGPVVPGHGDLVDRAFAATQRQEIAAAISWVDDPAGPPPYGPSVMDTLRLRLAAEDAPGREDGGPPPPG